MKIEIVPLSKLNQYFKKKKLEEEIVKTEKTIEKHNDIVHSNLEYLSVLHRDLEEIKRSDRASKRRKWKKR